MEAQTTSGLDLAAVWAQGDAVAHTVALLLMLMSVASWAIILGKSWLFIRLRRKAARTLEQFWDSPTVEGGIARLAALPAFAELARQGEGAMKHLASHAHEKRHLDSHLSASELVTRALRNSIARATSRLEGGLTLLASVGSTAPFIGLFGTVWGIYHALIKIGATGQSGIGEVAGPVGEALIMTATGLFVAIPAVLAYNAFNRSLALIVADLEAFAHDLHAYFTTGHPLFAENGEKRKLALVAGGV